MHAVTPQTPKRAVQFGIYRDGDNNLDQSQAVTLAQALTVSAQNPGIGFSIEDTTSRHGGSLRTLDYRIDGGSVDDAHNRAGENMSDPATLAHFVARTLDDAQRNGSAQTWIELSDHGAGDGGGLASDTFGSIMSSENIAAAIASGVAEHARSHPEDATRGIDGVVANQCLMASLGFADALSRAGVKFLAASPETMISPGTPSTVADAIAKNTDDTGAMAKAVVSSVMDFRYHAGGSSWAPAAAFDMLDLAQAKWNAVQTTVKHFNDDVAHASARDVAAIRDDAGNVPGMVRFPEATPDMPWHADRPAIALYGAIANDSRVNAQIRDDAAAARDAVAATVLADRESASFAPFDGANYRDAKGPTVHFATNAAQIDPWAPGVSETKTAFFKAVDGIAETRRVVG